MDAAGAAGGSGGGRHRSNSQRHGPNDGDDNAWDGEQRPINAHESTPPATTAATPAAATGDTLFTPPAACAPCRPAPSRAAHVGGGDDGSTTPLPQRGRSEAVETDGGAGPPATRCAPPSGIWSRPSAAAGALAAPPATPPEAADGGGAAPPRHSPWPSVRDASGVAAASAIPHWPPPSGDPPPAALRRAQVRDVGAAFATPPAACAPCRPAPSRATHVGGGDDGSTTPLPQRGRSEAVETDGGAGPPATRCAPPSGVWPRPSAAAGALAAPPATPPEAADGGGAAPPRRSPWPSVRDVSGVAAASATPHWPPPSGDPPPAALSRAQFRDAGAAFAAAAVARLRGRGATRFGPPAAGDATPLYFDVTRTERRAIRRAFAAHKAAQRRGRADGDAPPATARQGTAAAAGQRPAKAPRRQPKTCNECGDVLCDQFSLNRHVLHKHSGKEPHLCHLCGKRFPWYSSWSAHMQAVHHVERPHRCSWCTDKEVTFGTAGELRRHVDETHDEAKTCDVCGTQLATVGGLLRHRGRMHKGHHGAGSGKPPEGREQ